MHARGDRTQATYNSSPGHDGQQPAAGSADTAAVAHSRHGAAVHV